MDSKTSISSVFDQPGAMFTLLPPGVKYPPIERAWQKKPHIYDEAIAHEGNIGIMAGKGYIGLDQDDPRAFQGLELPRTTKWETRPGRCGLWFKCADVTPEVLAKYRFKANQSQIKLFNSRQDETKIVDGKEKKYYKPCGEVKLQRTYQVIPPSWKKIDRSRVDYKILEEVPPAEISLDWLLAELQKIGIVFHRSIKKSNENGSLWDPADKIDTIGKKKSEVAATKVSNYADAALRSEISKLSNTPEGDRNDQLNRSAFALGQLVAAGQLDEAKVKEELHEAALQVGLEPEEIERTIQSGLESGKRQPREIPEPREWRTQMIEAILFLDGCCDGARSSDGTGFNQNDTEWGKGFANKIKKGELIEDKELRYASKRISKYEKQLSCAGITLPNVPRSGIGDSMATLIVNQTLEGGAELWHSNDGKAYVTFEVDGHKEHYPLDSITTKGQLAKRFYEATQRTPGNQAINDALNVLRGKALYGSPVHPVYVRVALYEGKIYIDMGTTSWEVIEITSEGWGVMSNPPVWFRRPNTMLPLPIPKRGGSWDDFFKLLNLSDRNARVLIIGWLMQAYWLKGPFAHLVLTGEQGSGKSELAKILKQLVDPSLAILRRPPREERDLMIAAQAERIIAYDNLSGLPTELSDAFCALSTGGSIAGRKLYTDDEEAVLPAYRPVILNGIDAIATRGDLLDRSVLVDLPGIPEKNRKKDSDLEKEFKKLHPCLLALILDATAMGLKREDTIKLPSLPRMADYATWVTACEPALPWKEGEFLKAYRQANDDAITDLLESDPFAIAVIKLVGNGRIDLSATNLWNALNTKGGIDERHPPFGWPKSANGVKNKLKRIAPQLLKVGIAVKYTRDGKSRTIHLWSVAKYGDKLSDSCDSIVTTQNQSAVTEMTGVTTQSSFYLGNNEKKRKMREAEDKDQKDNGKKNPSLSSFPSLDSESSCHTNVTGSSQSSQLQESGPEPPAVEGIEAELRFAKQRREEREEHFKTPGRKYTHKRDLQELGSSDSPQLTNVERIRIACIMEFGINGWVDPRKVAGKLSLGVEEVDGWLKQNYDLLKKPGVVGYKQRVETLDNASNKDKECRETNATDNHPDNRTSTPIQRQEEKNEHKDGSQDLRIMLASELSRLEALNEPIVPAPISERLEFELPRVTDMLRSLGYRQTARMDKKSYLMIWEKGPTKPPGLKQQSELLWKYP